MIPNSAKILKLNLKKRKMIIFSHTKISVLLLLLLTVKSPILPNISAERPEADANITFNNSGL
jgi:hypothetical protein